MRDDTTVEKARRAGVPSLEGIAQTSREEAPKVWENENREVFMDQERKGNGEREKISPSILTEGKLERSKSPGEHTAPPRSNPSGSRKRGFFCGIKPLGRRSKAKKVLEESAEAGRD